MAVTPGHGIRTDDLVTERLFGFGFVFRWVSMFHVFSVCFLQGQAVGPALHSTAVSSRQTRIGMIT